VAGGGQARVIVLTTYDLDDAVHAGRCGPGERFLLKDARPADLVEAISALWRRGMRCSRRLSRGELLTGCQRASARTAQRRAGCAYPAGIEILRLVASALSNTEIAQRLGCPSHRENACFFPAAQPGCVIVRCRRSYLPTTTGLSRQSHPAEKL